MPKYHKAGIWSTDLKRLRFMFKTFSSSSSLVITSRWFSTSRLVASVSVRLVYCIALLLARTIRSAPWNRETRQPLGLEIDQILPLIMRKMGQQVGGLSKYKITNGWAMRYICFYINPVITSHTFLSSYLPPCEEEHLVVTHVFKAWQRWFLTIASCPCLVGLLVLTNAVHFMNWGLLEAGIQGRDN